jgi:hypothetical protein
MTSFVVFMSAFSPYEYQPQDPDSGRGPVLIFLLQNWPLLDPLQKNAVTELSTPRVRPLVSAYRKGTAVIRITLGRDRGQERMCLRAKTLCRPGSRDDLAPNPSGGAQRLDSLYLQTLSV